MKFSFRPVGIIALAGLVNLVAASSLTPNSTDSSDSANATTSKAQPKRSINLLLNHLGDLSRLGGMADQLQAPGLSEISHSAAQMGSIGNLPGSGSFEDEGYDDDHENEQPQSQSPNENAESYENDVSTTQRYNSNSFEDDSDSDYAEKDEQRPSFNYNNLKPNFEFVSSPYQSQHHHEQDSPPSYYGRPQRNQNEGSSKESSASPQEQEGRSYDQASYYPSRKPDPSDPDYFYPSHGVPRKPGGSSSSPQEFRFPLFSGENKEGSGGQWSNRNQIPDNLPRLFGPDQEAEFPDISKDLDYPPQKSSYPSKDRNANNYYHHREKPKPNYSYNQEKFPYGVALPPGGNGARFPIREFPHFDQDQGPPRNGPTVGTARTSSGSFGPSQSNRNQDQDQQAYLASFPSEQSNGFGGIPHHGPSSPEHNDPNDEGFGGLSPEDRERIFNDLAAELQPQSQSQTPAPVSISPQRQYTAAPIKAPTSTPFQLLQSYQEQGRGPSPSSSNIDATQAIADAQYQTQLQLGNAAALQAQLGVASNPSLQLQSPFTFSGNPELVGNSPLLGTSSSSLYDGLAGYGLGFGLDNTGLLLG